MPRRERPAPEPSKGKLSAEVCNHADMSIDKSGKWWRGSDASDIDEYLFAYTADGHPVTRVVHARCSECGGGTFSLRVDADEGCAERSCVACGVKVLMLDSADALEDADMTKLRCRPGHTAFNLAVGFAYRDDGDIRWVCLGCRCVTDGILGAVAEWKIDYTPSGHLLSAV